MLTQFIRHGIDIHSHHLKNVYVCTIGTSRKQFYVPAAEIICTMREGKDFDDLDMNGEPGSKYGPISPICLGYQGGCATMRPWDPTTCVIAAGIHNRLIHFPISLGCCVFALGCSLPTLSHLADIVGPGGRIISVIGTDHPERPSDSDLAKFSRRYPNVMVITEDMQTASLEGYKRLLSIPQESKYTFLMGLHPRVGAQSPVNVLGALDVTARNSIVQNIFSFLECSYPGQAKCLVVCHWPPGTRMDSVRDVVWRHVGILRSWRVSRAEEPQEASAEAVEQPGEKAEEKAEAEETAAEAKEEEANGKAGGGGEKADDKGQEKAAEKPAESSEEAGETSATDVRARRKGSTKSDSKGDAHSKLDDEAGHMWVLLDLATGLIVSDTQTQDINSKLTEMVEDIKIHKNGQRTGLFAKEQLLLTPYFPNRALLLLKYAAHRDEARGGVAKRREKSDIKVEKEHRSNAHKDSVKVEKEHRSNAHKDPVKEKKEKSDKAKPPSASWMPVPCFTKSGAAAASAPGLEADLSAAPASTPTAAPAVQTAPTAPLADQLAMAASMGMAGLPPGLPAPPGLGLDPAIPAAPAAAAAAAAPAAHAAPAQGGKQRSKNYGAGSSSAMQHHQQMQQQQQQQLQQQQQQQRQQRSSAAAGWPSSHHAAASRDVLQQGRDVPLRAPPGRGEPWMLPETLADPRAAQQAPLSELLGSSIWGPHSGSGGQGGSLPSAGFGGSGLAPPGLGLDDNRWSAPSGAVRSGLPPDLLGAPAQVPDGYGYPAQQSRYPGLPAHHGGNKGGGKGGAGRGRGSGGPRPPGLAPPGNHLHQFGAAGMPGGRGAQVPPQGHHQAYSF